jgi:hypothetical protein
MRIRAIVAVLALAMLAGPAAADAQVRFSGELSYGSEMDVGIGARLLANIKTLERWDFVGSFDWFFPSEPVGQDRSYWEINGNMAYNFPLAQSTVVPYAGAGLNIGHMSVEFDDASGASDTDLGLNLFGGTRFGKGPVVPFAELRFTVEGGDQVVITGGVLF